VDGGPEVTLRARLLFIFGTIVVVTVALVSYSVSAGARITFQQLDDQRTDALKRQFQREFELQGNSLAQRAGAIADSQPLRSMAITLSSVGGDSAPYLNLASSIAGEQQLDFLEILTQDGTIISSAQWPARFGLREPWVAEASDWNHQPAFLRYEETPQGNQLALLTVHELSGLADSSRKFYLVAGRRIDSSFLRTLVLPEGTRLLLWQNSADSDSGEPQDTSGPIRMPPALKPIIVESRSGTEVLKRRVRLDDASDGVYSVHTVPLMGQTSRQPLAILVVASSRHELSALQNEIRNIGLIVGLAGILMSVLASQRWAARISRPIEDLSAAAQDVAAGNWERKVDAESLNEKDEVARLIASFNQMTDELLRQRERALQAERVAAWRELARRLAHELKNPLFPLQITVENLTKARQLDSAEFDEIFNESTATLLAELSNLKKIIGRFSDFSKMPAPRLQSVDVNQLLREIAKLFAPQLAATNPPIKLETAFTSDDAAISGDPDLLRRAFENLILNAIDAMPQGGRLRIATSSSNDNLIVEISDSGAGFDDEEASRLFTPYYTTKQHGTGLGLAIVQSVISDHGASISVSSRPGEGTIFRMEFQRKAKIQPADALAGKV
jgi:two-component system, NtrC family, nitrogen regulation sensor histidine kinase NtrY